MLDKVLLVIKFNLKIHFWNAKNGIANKVTEIINYIKRRDIDILLVNETKLRANFKSKLRSYRVLRNDRLSDYPAGGLAVFIKRDIPFTEVKIQSDCRLETICIRLENNVYIVMAYNPAKKH